MLRKQVKLKRCCKHIPYTATAAFYVPVILQYGTSTMESGGYGLQYLRH